MKASELYDAVPAEGGVRLVAKLPIPTLDSASNFRGRGDTGKNLFGRERRTRTKDELLESLNSGKTIGLGTVWTGAGVNPELDEKVAPVRAFVAGFIPGNVVGAEDPGTVIDLAKVWLPRVEDEEKRKGLELALDEAEEEWKKDKRSSADTACDEPPSSEKTKDARSRPIMGNRLLPGVRAAFHDRTRTADYAKKLDEGRKDSTPAAPARVKTAADYAATLAAGRAKSA